MAAISSEDLSTQNSCCEQQGAPLQETLAPSEMLNVVQTCLHAQPSEWIFLHELRVGTSLRSRAAQRLDAFALNCYAHTAMRRICYEVKTSRADFLCEMKQPIKRRIGLRYSNEFYFVAPRKLLTIAEIPIECGLVEVGSFANEHSVTTSDQATIVHFDCIRNIYCRVTVPAPWRETPGPTWQFVASMLRNQQRAFHERYPERVKQLRLAFLE